MKKNSTDHGVLLLGSALLIGIFIFPGYGNTLTTASNSAQNNLLYATNLQELNQQLSVARQKKDQATIKSLKEQIAAALKQHNQDSQKAYQAWSKAHPQEAQQKTGQLNQQQMLRSNALVRQNILNENKTQFLSAHPGLAQKIKDDLAKRKAWVKAHPPVVAEPNLKPMILQGNKNTQAGSSA